MDGMEKPTLAEIAEAVERLCDTFPLPIKALQVIFEEFSSAKDIENLVCQMATAKRLENVKGTNRYARSFPKPAAPKPAAKPAPKAEVKPEPKPAPQPDPKPESESKLDPKPALPPKPE